ncbi:uncharacterized protein C1orf109 homolog [Actinia tenebrosa]|uniref:Uncharacterized protein C1orf109 homolog n=1 Tax=Actinia tenebrosa TaxID=6105 RepID=A0A6P8HQV4_ACTTE|nr:uncharacterized protein C1orf109 homolog [Actinia tenebrosa]
MEGLSLCYKKLRKVYTVLQELKTKVEKVHTDSCVQANSLANLLEQLAACDKVSFHKEPLVEMIDLKPKLRYKLVKAVESLLIKLRNDLSTLKDVSRKISECRKTSFDVYTQHATQGTLSLEDTLQGSPTCPSLTELLEWLSEIDSSYAQLYEEKLEIIESISYEEPTKSQEALRRWKSLALLSRNKIFADQIPIFLATHDGS